MSDWSTISTEDVYDYLAAEQVEALRSEALGDSQTDPLPTIIADVVERVRAEVRGNLENSVDETAGTVPPGLRGAAFALIVEAAQARLPVLEMSDDQVRLANAARALLKRVAEGGVGIESDTVDDSGAETDAVSESVLLVRSRSRFLSGDSLSAM